MIRGFAVSCAGSSRPVVVVRHDITKSLHNPLIYLPPKTLSGVFTCLMRTHTCVKMLFIEISYIAKRKDRKSRYGQ